MSSLPQNVRTRSPRPLASSGAASDRGIDHANRWGLTSSTIAPDRLTGDYDCEEPSATPPPVAVAVNAAPAEAVLSEIPGSVAPLATEAPLGEVLRHRSSALAALITVALVALGWTAWRRAPESANATAAARADAALLGDADAAAAPALRSGLRSDSAAEAGADTAVAPQPADASPASPLPAAPGVDHSGHVPIDGGVLVFPESFRATGDTFDLVIHFHGDVGIVKESVEHAGIDAALAIVNFGIRSVPYRQAYQAAGRFELLLAQIRSGVERRGMRNAKLGRMALTAWSGGYGGIESILEHRRAPHAEVDPLDAILILDGVHASFIDGDPRRISELSVLPYLRATRAAAEDKLLFTMTHSEIDPKLYASTKRSAELLLSSLGTKPIRNVILPKPEHLTLEAASRSIGRATELEPVSDTRVGSFRVQGFRGITPDDHASHLIQMASIALPELRERWDGDAAPRPRLRTKKQPASPGTKAADDAIRLSARAPAEQRDR